MKNFLKAAITLILPLCSIGTLGAEWNNHSLKNLEPVVEYRGYDFIRGDGQPVYHMNQTARIRVTILNHGNRPFKDYPVKASLFWAEDVSCTRFWKDMETVSYSPSQILPGGEFGPYALTIGGDSYSFFDVFYDIPDTVCPNSVRIKLDAGRKGGPDSDSLVLPEQFRIAQ
jgi:hypothetical protein